MQTYHRRVFLLVLITTAIGSGVFGVGQGTMVQRDPNNTWLLFQDAEHHPIARYVTGSLPEVERRPSVEGSCFTYPIQTPSGVNVTDMSPMDHPHHRGVFCGWIQVDGEKPGDWWGWGAKAPKDGRAVVNQSVQLSDVNGDARVRAVNSWKADGTTVLNERLTLTARQVGRSNILDYDYEFTTPTDKPVVIAQHPFGGFCYRAKPRGELKVTDPKGAVTHPDAVSDRLDRDWPSSHWYDLTYVQPDGEVNGVAVLDHPQNPPTTWHVVRGLHMLNPCIAAPGAVTLQPGKPLRLRYRLVAHDGDAASAHLEQRFTEWAGGH